MSVRIDTWPLDDESDPDLYVAIDKQASPKVNTFKSNLIGANRITVLPKDAKFKTGTWSVAV